MNDLHNMVDDPVIRSLRFGLMSAERDANKRGRTGAGASPGVCPLPSPTANPREI
jgi:hypothetical protein